MLEATFSLKSRVCLDLLKSIAISIAISSSLLLKWSRLLLKAFQALSVGHSFFFANKRLASALLQNLNGDSLYRRIRPEKLRIKIR